MLQKLSAIVLGVATSVLPITIMAGDDPKKEFVNALKGQTVVLKHDVYTIHYVSAKGGTQTMRSRVAGVLTVSPGREAPYYQADFVGMGMMADSDQQKLVDKVSMRMASGTGNWLSGDQTATRSTAGAKLMKYDARSRMKVKDVRFDDDT
ncbi:MAG TPA: hypothetical protein VD998_00125, partial [Verrucomicrobiae bacterium]|nr:hypothetical protein [Verrucomicrobiae bacterium]